MLRSPFVETTCRHLELNAVLKRAETCAFPPHSGGRLGLVWKREQ